jgi:hypothetical protein
MGQGEKGVFVFWIRLTAEKPKQMEETQKTFVKSKENHTTQFGAHNLVLDDRLQFYKLLWGKDLGEDCRRGDENFPSQD